MAVLSGIEAVSSFGALLKELLEEARAVKQATTIEPPLHKTQFDQLEQRVAGCFTQGKPEGDAVEGEELSTTAKARRNAIVETAARDLFGSIVASTTIDSPDFVIMWNFLDLLSFLSDDENCEPGLPWWLLEELLDSQTIAGCRRIFDYLESRRERLTTKHFKAKSLVILRSCNELLRRLSRAEDTAFCGRVFIFLFQSFPLGDPSSVNRRGEFHIENTTDYEVTPTTQSDGMDVDSQGDAAVEDATADGAKKSETAALYPMFWSLQESFSQPLRLFEGGNLSKFKEDLAATVAVFKNYPGDEGSRYLGTDEVKKDNKRKRDTDESATGPQAAFNPKYLTSKDLFELEISDLSFRRHILVQGLILLDFLLSLSAAAKETFNAMAPTNRSVMYAAELGEDDTKWASEMKQTISEYLRPNPEGQYFFRMVDTVLMRDKNWVVWKMAGCPPIKRDPIDPAAFAEARATVQKAATSKRLRPVPMGSVSLDFLRGVEDDPDMQTLKQKEKYELPELAEFKSKIADDDFEISMPTNQETKARAVAGKASKSWRALRIAGRDHMATFDRMDDPKKIDAIFGGPPDADDEGEDAEPTAAEDAMPPNKDPLIIAGAASSEIVAVIEKLVDTHKGVFGKVVRHAAREPEDGEKDGETFRFVKVAEFNQLRDGDRLVESGERDGISYGTSTQAIEAVSESGKVPVIRLDLEAAQFAKDMDFQARYVFIKPSSSSAESTSPAEDLFDVQIESGESVDETVQRLQDFIFKKEGEEEEEAGGDAGDKVMADITVEENGEKS